MKLIRTLGLAAVLGLGGLGAAVAGPMNIAPVAGLAPAQPVIEQAAWACGPYRCWHRPGWGYYHRWGWHRHWRYHRRWW